MSVTAGITVLNFGTKVLFLETVELSKSFKTASFLINQETDEISLLKRSIAISFCPSQKSDIAPYSLHTQPVGLKKLSQCLTYCNVCLFSFKPSGLLFSPFPFFFSLHGVHFFHSVEWVLGRNYVIEPISQQETIATSSKKHLFQPVLTSLQ